MKYFYTDNEIRSFIDEYIDQNKSITYSIIRNKFNIGNYRVNRILKEYYDNNILCVNERGKIVLIKEDFHDFKEEFIKNIKHEDENEKEEELLVDKVYQLTKSLQKSRDELRILRKSLRDQNRTEHITEITISEIKKYIPILQEPKKQKQNYSSGLGKVVIIQLSDLHLGEVVFEENVKGSNEFNWEVASKRLQKYAHECIKYIDFEEVNDVIIAITGDVINSDRRFDEIVNNASSRAVTLLKSVDLLSHFISHIYEYVENITVISVFGNESRIPLDINSIRFEDNYDFLIHYFLEARLQNYNNLDFIPPKLDHSVVIRDVLGANILLAHGHNKTDFKKESLKYSLDPEDSCPIHFMLGGHIHETMIKGEYRRSASLVGNNAYSYHRLGLHGYAEQNFHLIIQESNKRLPIVRTIPINLDFTGGYNGYPISSDNKTIDGINPKKTFKYSVK